MYSGCCPANRKRRVAVVRVAMARRASDNALSARHSHYSVFPSSERKEGGGRDRFSRLRREVRRQPRDHCIVEL